MTMRNKLLLLFLPIMVLFTLALSFLLYFHWQIEIIIGAILFLIILLFFVTRKIAKPIEELKMLALSIAAGSYESIHVKGPKEVVDLANTINTMSACLKEQITRLQESALMRERMYGEYECSVLLEYYMLQRIMEQYTGERLRFKSLDLISDQITGLILNISDDSLNTDITLVEAEKKGLQGIYELLATAPFISEASLTRIEYPSLELHFNHETNTLTSTCYGLPPPFIWHTSQGKAAESETPCQLQTGDLIFLYNQGFVKHFANETAIHAWFGKVLRHFAPEGLDVAASMLEKELLFFGRKRHIDDDIHLVCVAVN